MKTDRSISTPRELGQHARSARRALGLSQQDLAGLCRVGTRFISDLENGKATLQIGKAMSVLRALGLSLHVGSARGMASPAREAHDRGLIANFRRFQRKSAQSEARTNLSGLATTMRAHFGEHNEYPATFEAARFSLPGAARYAYFLAPTEVLGGELHPDREELLRLARAAFRSTGTRPRVRRHRFRAAAFAIYDSPDDVDLWTIDETGTLVHVLPKE